MKQHSEKQHIDALPKARLREAVAAMGQPAYRADQLFKWLHQKQVDSFDAMTNLPAAFRAQLAEQWTLSAPRIAQRQTSGDGTAKLLIGLADGNSVETVLMRYKHGPSVCVSSQVGCRMGCAFCASSVKAMGFTPGLVRNLSAGEMAAQVYLAQRAGRELPAPAGVDAPGGDPHRVNHLVLMGIGEPLDNFEAVMDFLSIITDPDGQNLSFRNISLSTCGVVPGIDRLAGCDLPLTLSVSLHAADDATREKLMPVNRSWPLAELMAACKRYRTATGRRISYEYALFEGMNDRPEDTVKLVALLAGQDAHVNLIGANPVAGSPYQPTPRGQIEAFQAALRRGGVNATIRRRLGVDIDAACGQLRQKRHNLAEEKQNINGA